MAEITNPHDKFFKENFTHKEIAKAFIREYLPDTILRDIDLNTLRIIKDSFIEKELGEYFSDIIYKVRINNRDSYLYLLFEHKSYPETKTGFYLLRNMVKLWEHVIKQRGKPFPVIIPLVIYHGREKWKEKRFIDLFGEINKELQAYIPEFRHEIYDISHLKDEDIKGEVRLRVMLLILKYIFRDELRERLHDILVLLQELEGKREGIEYLEVLLRYLVNAAEKINKEEIVKALKDTVRGGERLMPTIAQQWKEEGIQQGIQKGIQQGIQKGIQQGIQKGIQQGIQKGIQDGLIDVLEERFGVVPIGLQEEIRGISSIGLLEGLVKDAVKVGSIEEFKVMSHKAKREVENG